MSWGVFGVHKTGLLPFSALLYTESETDTVTEPEELLDDEQQQDPEQVAEQLGVISDLGPTYALHAVTRKGAPKV
jgi:hypothetical protein